MSNPYVSMRSFAKMAGVSLATASRTFSQPETVSGAMKERLEKLAEEVGFTPNILARSAFGKSTQSVGVLLDDLANSYFGSIAQGIQKTLLAVDYLPIMVADPLAAPKTLARLLRHQIAALIIGVADERMDIPKLCRRQIDRLPIVTLEFLRPGLWCDAVLNDDRDGGHQAAEHLISCGYKNFGACAYGEGISTCVQRLAGFQNTLELHGFSLPPENVVHMNVAFAPAERQKAFADGVKAMLSRPDRPDAIFAPSDFFALDVLNFAAQCGLRVPQDLGVVGFGALPFTEYANPPLTSVAQDPETIGNLAAELALKRIESPERPREQLHVPVRLVARGSTRQLPAAGGRTRKHKKIDRRTGG